MDVRWEKPRRFVVKLWEPTTKSVVGHHETLGIVAYCVGDALRAAEERFPTMRVNSVNDTGAVDLVVGVPIVGSSVPA